jgi:hypothetical protein
MVLLMYGIYLVLLPENSQVHGQFSITRCQAVRARLVDVLFVSPERRGFCRHLQKSNVLHQCTCEKSLSVDYTTIYYTILNIKYKTHAN